MALAPTYLKACGIGIDKQTSWCSDISKCVPLDEIRSGHYANPKSFSIYNSFIHMYSKIVIMTKYWNQKHL